jgi:hypothetical protein
MNDRPDLSSAMRAAEFAEVAINREFARPRLPVIEGTLSRLQQPVTQVQNEPVTQVQNEPEPEATEAPYLKLDQGKLRWDLLPQDALEQVVGVMTVDADTRGRGWERGCEWHRPLASALRHISAWQRGEQMDAGTKRPHLACAVAQLLFLLAYEQRGHGVDDRSTREVKP